MHVATDREWQQRLARHVVVICEVRQALSPRERLDFGAAGPSAHEQEEDPRIVFEAPHGLEDRAEIVHDARRCPST